MLLKVNITRNIYNSEIKKKKISSERSRLMGDALLIINFRKGKAYSNYKKLKNIVPLKLNFGVPVIIFMRVL